MSIGDADFIRRRADVGGERAQITLIHDQRIERGATFNARCFQASANRAVEGDLSGQLDLFLIELLFEISEETCAEEDALKFRSIVGGEIELQVRLVACDGELTRRVQFGSVRFQVGALNLKESAIRAQCDLAAQGRAASRFVARCGIQCHLRRAARRAQVCSRKSEIGCACGFACNQNGTRRQRSDEAADVQIIKVGRHARRTIARSRQSRVACGATAHDVRVEVVELNLAVRGNQSRTRRA